jgi:hypothetical protein
MKNCKYCKGTGKIELVFSVVDCLDCSNKNNCLEENNDISYFKETYADVPAFRFCSGKLVYSTTVSTYLERQDNFSISALLREQEKKMFFDQMPEIEFQNAAIKLKTFSKVRCDWIVNIVI